MSSKLPSSELYPSPTASFVQNNLGPFSLTILWGILLFVCLCSEWTGHSALYLSSKTETLGRASLIKQRLNVWCQSEFPQDLFLFTFYLFTYLFLFVSSKNGAQGFGHAGHSLVE